MANFVGKPYWAGQPLEEELVFAEWFDTSAKYDHPKNPPRDYQKGIMERIPFETTSVCINSHDLILCGQTDKHGIMNPVVWNPGDFLELDSLDRFFIDEPRSELRAVVFRTPDRMFYDPRVEEDTEFKFDLKKFLNYVRMNRG